MNAAPQRTPAPRRYAYREVPLSLLEARRLKAEVIWQARRNVRYFQEQLDAAKDDLHFAKRSSLQDSRTEQITLYPGDPGYFEAPVTIDFAAYQGDFTWFNINPTSPEKP